MGVHREKKGKNRLYLTSITARKLLRVLTSTVFDVFVKVGNYQIYHHVENLTVRIYKKNYLNPLIRWKDQIFYAHHGCRSDKKSTKKIDIKYGPAKVPSVSLFHVVHYFTVIEKIIYQLFANFVVRPALKQI